MHTEDGGLRNSFSELEWCLTTPDLIEVSPPVPCHHHLGKMTQLLPQAWSWPSAVDFLSGHLTLRPVF